MRRPCSRWGGEFPHPVIPAFAGMTGLEGRAEDEAGVRVAGAQLRASSSRIIASVCW